MSRRDSDEGHACRPTAPRAHGRLAISNWRVRTACTTRWSEIMQRWVACFSSSSLRLMMS